MPANDAPAGERRVALVTGGGSGIGRASCARLLQDGFRLAVLDLDGAAAAEAAGPDGLGLAADVADATSVERAVKTAVAEFGRIDVLFNNAGITGSPAATRCHETPIEEWDRVLGVNLRGPFLVTHAVLPVMLDRGGGQVINLVSIAGIVATRGRCAYTASKGGALMFTKSLAADYAADGIRANAICPGWVHTPMTAWRLEDPELGPRAVAGIPMGRVARPEEIAELVSVLAGDRLAYVTGSAFVIDGGMTSTIML
jgi:NAD(P)-dependent dehydrogenase (short-subunit alcohol dehydrogenase family)